MRTIVVDDEKMALVAFMEEAKNIKELDIAGVFDNAKEAVEFIKDNDVELAILDVKMKGIDGINLGSIFRDINPDIMLIYITGYEKYAYEAIKIHAAAYLVKPFSSEQLEYAVESARLLSKRRKSKIYVRTFGHFDIFVDDNPVMFKSHKAKELLALLVDRRGGTVTTDQIIGTLWEERPNDPYTQNLCSKIGKTLEKELKENNIGDILVSARGVKRVNTLLFKCDLYDLLDGDERAAEKFLGEYMLDYSWAEERMALLAKYI